MNLFRFKKQVESIEWNECKFQISEIIHSNEFLSETLQPLFVGGKLKCFPS